jgi:excisionase family DNA binding protein
MTPQANQPTSRNTTRDDQQNIFRIPRISSSAEAFSVPVLGHGTNAAEQKETIMAIQPELDLWVSDAAVPTLVTVKEAGRILSVSRSTLYELIAGGRLETVHIGRSVRVPLDAIATYINTLRQADRSRD